MGMSGYEFQTRLDAALMWLDKGQRYLRTARLSSAEQAAVESKVQALRDACIGGDHVAAEKEAAAIEAVIKSSAPPAGKAIPELPHPRGPQAKRAPQEDAEPLDDANDLIGECDTNETSEAPKPSTSMLDDALAYAALGWLVLPIKRGSKRPLGGLGIKHATTDGNTIRKWFARWADAGIGVFLKGAGLCAIDIDPRNGATKAPTDFSATLTARTGGGGWHLIYRVPEGATLPGKLAPGIDLKFDGYILVQPSLHPNGERYAWIDWNPRLVDLLGAPHIADFPQELLGSSQPIPAKPEHDDLNAAVALANFTDETREDLRSALAAIPSDDRDLWVRVGHALKPLGDMGRMLWIEWSQKSLKFDSEDAERVWESLAGERTDYRAIFAEAQRGGWKNPREGKAPTVERRAETKFVPKPRTGSSLMQKTFEPLIHIITDFMTEGLHMLAAAPKIGKSWLALQSLIAVVTGGTVLGFQANQHEVLFLGLEDNDRRLQARLRTLGFDALPGEVQDRAHFETAWPRLGEGGEGALDKYLDEHPDIKFVVIDVLEGIHPKRQNKHLYSEDYEALRPLKELAHRRHIAILVIHHTRKAAAFDPMQIVSGSNGLTGAADSVWVLNRDRDGKRGDLTIMARDLEQHGTFAVEFENARWSMLGPASKVAATARQEEILATLRAHGAMSAAQLANAMGVSRQSVHKTLGRMVGAGPLACVEGKYQIKAADDLSVPTGASDLI